MNQSALLAISLVGNVGLAAGLLYLSAKKPTTSSTETVVITNTVETPQAPSFQRLLKPKSTGLSIAESVDWTKVESDDYKKYIANLRSIGCPEETIRDIIVADVNKMFASRAKEKTEPFKFWKPSKGYAGFTPEKIQERLEQGKEKKALLKELLGVDIADASTMSDTFNPMADMFSFLPAEKQGKLGELEADFAAKTMKTLGDNKGRSSKETADLYRELQKEKRAEMAKILTPQELEDYDLRLSPTANMMRSNLGDFELTEQEFRDMFKVRQKFDDGLMVPRNSSDPAEKDRRDLAQLEMNRELKQTLGEQRYSQMENERQWSQSSLAKLSEQHNVPKENVYQAFDVRRETQEEAVRIRTDPNLSPEQKQTSLNDLRNIAEESWKKVLGEPAYNDYAKKSSSWFEEVSPRRQKPAVNVNEASGDIIFQGQNF